jgi:hypothetical protein
MDESEPHQRGAAAVTFLVCWRPLLNDTSGSSWTGAGFLAQLHATYLACSFNEKQFYSAKAGERPFLLRFSMYRSMHITGQSVSELGLKPCRAILSHRRCIRLFRDRVGLIGNLALVRRSEARGETPSLHGVRLLGDCY